MAIPKITDLILYINKKITGADWNTNFQKFVNWLTGGSADVKFNSVDTNSVTTSGTITSNGATINGNAEISGNLQVGGVISGDGGGLTNIRSTSTIAWTPFTVNKGYIGTTPEDTSTYGKEILMIPEDSVGTSSIKFNVPITATTSDGTNFTLNQLDDCDVSGLRRDGIFIVCIKKDQQRAELKEGIYRQRLAPTDVNIQPNTLWLDTSVENIQCYEKLNNAWTTKYDGVPIGEVDVTSGVINSVKTYHYNWNGYNINVQEEINIAQRPSVIIKTWYADNINWSSKQSQTDYYIEYSNGFIIQGGRIKWNDGGNGNQDLPLSVMPSKVCTVNCVGFNYNGYTSGGTVQNISNSAINVYGGTTGNHEGVLLWEVKGYK